MLPSLLLEGSQRAREEVDSLVSLIYSLRLPWMPARPDFPKRNQRDEHEQQTKQQRVKAALISSGVVDGVSIWRARLLSSVSIIQFGGVATAAINCMSPQVGYVTRVHSYRNSTAPQHPALHTLQMNRFCLLGAG